MARIENEKLKADMAMATKAEAEALQRCHKSVNSAHPHLHPHPHRHRHPLRLCRRLSLYRAETASKASIEESRTKVNEAERRLKDAEAKVQTLEDDINTLHTQLQQQV